MWITSQIDSVDGEAALRVISSRFFNPGPKVPPSLANKAPRFSTPAEAARNRIERALAQLEAAIDDKLAEGAKPAEADPEIAEKLAAAHREIAGLKDRNRQVSDKLDKAIGRIKSMLGE